MAEGIVIEDVADDLRRLQNFDPNELIQREKLGADFAFDAAVRPAERLVNLFKKLPADVLDEFPHQQLTQMQNTFKGAYKLLEDILNFSPKVPDAEAVHQGLIKGLQQAYQQNFTTVFPFISFGVARTVDFNQLAADGRAAVQAVRDETRTVLEEVEGARETSKEVLKDVREAAAEQGVTQQARYFEAEATSHEEASERWKVGTMIIGVLVLGYAVASLFFPQIEVLKADSISEAIQITVSKILIFFILVSLLLLFIRNFTAHKHNAILNRHRQNALMTYTTLAEAGNSAEARDTVLQHAAAAIYAPSDSGYIKNEERGYVGSMPLAVSPRLAAGATGADG